MVLDDATGTAQWYLNGVADGSPTTFTPNTFTFQAGEFVIGGYGTSTSLVTRYMEMDDFRLYSRALTPAELMTAMASENPSTSTFGDGCTGPSVVPQIGRERRVHRRSATARSRSRRAGWRSVFRRS
jgi:hypothetical protein